MLLQNYSLLIDGLTPDQLPVKTTLLQNCVVERAPRTADQLPVKTTLLQNAGVILHILDIDQLPVKTTLLQNHQASASTSATDQLPVKTTLLQNQHNTTKTQTQRSVTSQNDAAPKHTLHVLAVPIRSVTSQNDAAPKHPSEMIVHKLDQLPVKTTLLQNNAHCDQSNLEISYQSKRRCSKTVLKCDRTRVRSVTSQNDAAPKPESYMATGWRDQLPVKTTLLQNQRVTRTWDGEISYQSKRRCSKTCHRQDTQKRGISYQSKRRCSKTGQYRIRYRLRSVTSQNDAAPKPLLRVFRTVPDQLPVKTTLLQNWLS